MIRTPTVGVIGAGVAGLACAQVLHRSGVEVTVLEKSRGVGGRVATRRLDSGLAFDHGAQYFTVREAIFGDQVKRWRNAGVVDLWRGRIVKLDQGMASDLEESRERYVGTPGMNAIAKEMATNVKVQANVTLKSLQCLDGKWQGADTAGAIHGPFNWIISTAPPPQTSALIQNLSSAFEQRIPRVSMAPCWAVMVHFSKPVPLPFEGAFVHNSPLSWIASNSSKPQRSAPDCWVLHAAAAWSAMHLEESPEAIATTLVAELWQATRQAPQTPELLVAHRWRYAIPHDPLSDRFLIDGDQKLGACGDWCQGPRVEGAYLSGVAMAEAVLATL